MRAIVAVLALGLIAAPAFADDAPPPAPAGTESIYGSLEQTPLTEDQVKHYVASLEEMQTAMGDAPPDAAEPDAKTMTKLEGVARKYGFKDFAEYNKVAGNIAIVVDGVDPDTKKYVGTEKMIERAIDDTKSETQMSDADKKATIADLQAQLKTVTPIKYKGNIDLVLQHYDELNGDAKAAPK
jgi:hypothetical protein